MYSRRRFLTLGANTGLAAATAPLWMHLSSARAFGAISSSGSYKAIILVSLQGGNDANNLLIPLDRAEYNEYSSVRGSLSLSAGDCLLLNPSSGSLAFGMHPVLKNIAELYNGGRAAVVANVGPLAQPSTKEQLLANPSLIPEALLSHPAGVAQWESATTLAVPPTGWGGRLADLISTQSGLLPPLLNAGLDSTFTVGQTIQGVAVQAANGAFTPIPASLNSTILNIASNDLASENRLVG